jgi:SNF2 family DNA or RNA helicase
MAALALPQVALDGAHKLLSLFCLRRVKREVEVSLPPLIETRVECPLSSLQTFWYRRLLLREYQTLLKKVEAEEGGDAAPATAVQEGAPEAGAWKKLQVCDHPM